MEKSKVYKVVWILLLSTMFTIDSALFGNDHVPYWAYFIRFVVIALILMLAQKAVSGDAETVKGRRQAFLLLAAVSAIVISVMVMWFLHT